jgi:hypothetical protein
MVPRVKTGNLGAPYAKSENIFVPSIERRRERRHSCRPSRSQRPEGRQECRRSLSRCSRARSEAPRVCWLSFRVFLSGFVGASSGLGRIIPVGNRGGAARRSRNQRSADSLVREALGCGRKHADKAVRAPEESSQNATIWGHSTAKAAGRKGRLPQWLGKAHAATAERGLGVRSHSTRRRAMEPPSHGARAHRGGVNPNPEVEPGASGSAGLLPAVSPAWSRQTLLMNRRLVAQA